MSSDEDFDAAPDVRQSTEYARVCPYIFEPLAAKPISPEVGLESDNESSNHESLDDVSDQLIVSQAVTEAEAGSRQDASSSLEQEWCVAVSITVIICCTTVDWVEYRVGLLFVMINRTSIWPRIPASILSFTLVRLPFTPNHTSLNQSSL